MPAARRGDSAYLRCHPADPRRRRSLATPYSRSDVRSLLGVVTGPGPPLPGESAVALDHEQASHRQGVGPRRTYRCTVATLPAARGSLAGFCNHNMGHATYPGRVVCAAGDRSGVGCSHRVGCPLFPLLNASLRGWRDHYCDSEDRWHDCARYKLSLTGQLVPITLLPNGHDAQLLRPDNSRSGAAETRRAPKQAPPSQVDSESLETAVALAQFEPVPAPEPARPVEPSPPPQVPESPESPPPPSTRPVRQARGSKRHGRSRLTGWWTRLADWITGPA